MRSRRSVQVAGSFDARLKEAMKAFGPDPEKAIHIAMHRCWRQYKKSVASGARAPLDELQFSADPYSTWGMTIHLLSRASYVSWETIPNYDMCAAQMQKIIDDIPMHLVPFLMDV